MKFIPKELEDNLVAALSAALSAAEVPAGACSFAGTWRTSAQGYVRWLESGASPALVCVSVATSVPKTYTQPAVDFLANIELFVRPEKDTDGALLLSISTAIENTLRAWQAETYQQAFTLLDVVGEFAVGDVVGNQGTAPTIQNDRCSVSWPITISGTYTKTN